MLGLLILWVLSGTGAVISYTAPSREYEFSNSSSYPADNSVHGDTGITNYPTIVVGKQGEASFSTIQAAINSVPSNNNIWVRIYVKAGVYAEKVHIPEWKPCILLQGEGMYRTQIVSNEHYSIKKPTFQSSAHNFVAMNIGFVNSYNYPAMGNNNQIVPAVAAMIEGDMSAFYGCGFFGLQDTLWDVQGRHYYEACDIVGAADFIFGNGQSMFHECSVIVTSLPPGYIGYITAQGRGSPKDKSGFVFKNCEVKGRLTHLGRAWGPFARVVFYESRFDTIIANPRWGAWNFPRYMKEMTFQEVKCSGRGAKSARLENREEMGQYGSLDFIEAKEWLWYQPKP